MESDEDDYDLGSPADEGWYELVNGKYTPSTDTYIVGGKTYYIEQA